MIKSKPEDLIKQMDTKARLQNDMKEAMKNKDNETRDVLRLIMAAIKQVEVDTQKELDEVGVQQLLIKQSKQRRESIAEYDKAGRSDLIVQEQIELNVIDRYLPQMMSREEIMALAKAAIAETGATDAKGTGAVMSKLMPQVKGKADGKLVQEVVKELLTP